MRWMCAGRPDVDVLASIWLIRRYVDRDATIVLDAAVSADCDGELRDDLVERRHDLTVFETLITNHDLIRHAALQRMAVVVRAASFDDELDLDLAGLGVGMIGVGARYAERDDAQLIDRTEFVFDALFAWCEADVGRVSAR